MVAMLPEIRAGLVRNVAEVLDDVILNADETDTNNINADGATISKSDAGKGHWLLGYDGILHLPLVDNVSQRNIHGAGVSDDMFSEIRSKLGKYGARPSELAWVMDVNTFIRAQSISQFRTMDKLGPNATLLTGMLGAVEGIPVIVSEQMQSGGRGRQGHGRRQRERGRPPADLQPDPVDAGVQAQGLDRRGKGHAEAPDGRHSEPEARSHGALGRQVDGDAYGSADQHHGSVAK